MKVELKRLKQGLENQVGPMISANNYASPIVLVNSFINFYIYIVLKTTKHLHRKLHCVDVLS